MAIFFRNKIFTLKTETVYGTDAAPTPALNSMLALDVILSPMEGQDVDRNLDLSYFGNTGTLVADLHMKMAFKVELEPSGTAGTAPAWGPAIMACGMAQTVVAVTSVTYNPITDLPTSASIHFWVGNTQYRMLGARGTFKMMWDKQGIPYLEFTLTGLFNVATEGARPTGSVFTAFKTPKIAAKRHAPTFTLGGVSSLKLSALSLDLANAVEPRLLINSEEILITGRNPKLDMVVEAEALSLLNPFQTALDSGSMALQFIHGTVAGKRATLNVPALQIARPTSLDNAQGVVNWPLSGMPLPVTGNDEFTLVLT